MPPIDPIAPPQPPAGGTTPPAEPDPSAAAMALNSSSRAPAMPGPTPDQLAQLKAQHGNVYRVHAKLDDAVQVFLVRVATPGEWGRFMAMIGDDKKRASALDVLLRQVALWPSVEQREVMLTRYPGLVETFGNRLTEICGLTASAEAEKL